MTSYKKPVFISILLIAGIVIGFIFLLKGCLAKYDERFAKPDVLAFTKNGKTVIFSVVEFQKTTSYSRKGSMVRRSVNTSYYIQTNDGETADIINSQKIISHRKLKNHPLEIMGAAGDNAWLFMDGPAAFDAFTLEKKADIATLEKNNPFLKDLFSLERRFYYYNRNDQHIYFTAKDGTKWQLNTSTLIATPSNWEKGKSQFAEKMDAIKMDLKNLDAAADSLYQQKNYRPSKDYSTKKISAAQYQQITSSFYKERDSLDELKDSLQIVERRWRSEEQKIEAVEREIEGLQYSRGSFSQLKSNQATDQQKWYGFYSDKEFAKLNTRVYNSKAYDETARRTLWTCAYTINSSGDIVIDKTGKNQTGSESFLDGGFLLDKKTAEPVRPEGSFLILHKNQVGLEGKINVSKLSIDGKKLWTFNTELSDWADWIYSAEKLYILGRNNKDLSSSECNLLICLNLKDGTVAMYDYFKKKKIK
jgi:hypothetical protein